MKPGDPTPDVIVIPPEGGQTLAAFGSETVFKLLARDTAGTFCLAIASTPPGGGPPPHVHRKDDELFVVLEGQLTFFTAKGPVRAPTGSVVYAPRNAPHTFRNDGSSASRHLVLVLPSGFDEFYARSAEVFAAGGPPDRERLMAIAADYGYEFMPRGSLPGEGPA